MTKEFIRIVCVDDSDPLEYKVLEDTNRGSLEELHRLLDENFYEHGANAKWILSRGTCEMK